MTELSRSTTVAVLGAGTMGAGIAQVAAAAGHKVYLYDINAVAIENGIAQLSDGLAKQVAREKISPEQKEAILAKISPATKLSDLAEVGLVIEAIVENLEVKQKVFAELEKVCADHVILASNTSSISITSIGAKLKRPERLVGMHFFNPAPILKLVEVIKGRASGDSAAQIIYDTAKKWGKTPVFAQSSPGFIVNRVARAFYAEGLRVLEEGAADIATIDTVMREAGNFRMGPFELMDLIGHDVNFAVTCSVYDAYFQDPRFKPSLTQQELVNAGFLGRKSGRGFYDYRGDVKPEITNHAQQPRPSVVKANICSGAEATLVAMANTAAIEISETTDGAAGSINVDGVTLALTDGRSATQRAANLLINNLVLFDLAFDYQQNSRIVLSVADQAQEGALEKVIGFFQALDKQVSIIDDIPGMILMRTVCMLANEAADAVNQGVASASDIDIAMCNGVNYPRGPLVWADALGIAKVHDVLTNLQATYGEDRYRCSILIKRHAFTNSPFYNE